MIRLHLFVRRRLVRFVGQDWQRRVLDHLARSTVYHRNFLSPPPIETDGQIKYWYLAAALVLLRRDVAPSLLFVSAKRSYCAEALTAIPYCSPASAALPTRSSLDPIERSSPTIAARDR